MWSTRRVGDVHRLPPQVRAILASASTHAHEINELWSHIHSPAHARSYSEEKRLDNIFNHGAKPVDSATSNYILPPRHLSLEDSLLYLGSDHSHFYLRSTSGDLFPVHIPVLEGSSPHLLHALAARIRDTLQHLKDDDGVSSQPTNSSSSNHALRLPRSDPYYTLPVDKESVLALALTTMSHHASKQLGGINRDLGPANHDYIAQEIHRGGGPDLRHKLNRWARSNHVDEPGAASSSSNSSYDNMDNTSIAYDERAWPDRNVYENVKIDELMKQVLKRMHKARRVRGDRRGQSTTGMNTTSNSGIGSSQVYGRYGRIRKKDVYNASVHLLQTSGRGWINAETDPDVLRLITLVEKVECGDRYMKHHSNTSARSEYNISYNGGNSGDISTNTTSFRARLITLHNQIIERIESCLDGRKNQNNPYTHQNESKDSHDTVNSSSSSSSSLFTTTPSATSTSSSSHTSSHSPPIVFTLSLSTPELAAIIAILYGLPVPLTLSSSPALLFLTKLFSLPHAFVDVVNFIRNHAAIFMTTPYFYALPPSFAYRILSQFPALNFIADTSTSPYFRTLELVLSRVAPLPIHSAPMERLMTVITDYSKFRTLLFADPQLRGKFLKQICEHPIPTKPLRLFTIPELVSAGKELIQSKIHPNKDTCDNTNNSSTNNASHYRLFKLFSGVSSVAATLLTSASPQIRSVLGRISTSTSASSSSLTINSSNTESFTSPRSTMHLLSTSVLPSMPIPYVSTYIDVTPSPFRLPLAGSWADDADEKANLNGNQSNFNTMSKGATKINHIESIIASLNSFPHAKVTGYSHTFLFTKFLNDTVPSCLMAPLPSGNSSSSSSPPLPTHSIPRVPSLHLYDTNQLSTILSAYITQPLRHVSNPLHSNISPSSITSRTTTTAAATTPLTSFFSALLASLPPASLHALMLDDCDFTPSTVSSQSTSSSLSSIPSRRVSRNGHNLRYNQFLSPLLTRFNSYNPIPLRPSAAVASSYLRLQGVIRSLALLRMNICSDNDVMELIKQHLSETSDSTYNSSTNNDSDYNNSNYNNSNNNSKHSVDGVWDELSEYLDVIDCKDRDAMIKDNSIEKAYLALGGALPLASLGKLVTFSLLLL